MALVNPRRLAILALLGLFLALTPLAQASPPDQTWVGGFYDDADYDDVVLLVTEGLNAIQLALVPVLLLVAVVVAQVPAAPPETRLAPVRLSEAGRAPPLS